MPKQHIPRQTYSITFYSSKTDIVPKVMELSWSELKDRLRHPEVRKSKDGRLFSPARLNGSRKNKNVQDISMLVVEYDHNEQFENAVETWKQLGVEFVAYTTHSHLRTTESNPNAEPRVRVVIPLKEPISPSEHNRLFEWAALQTGNKIDRAPRASSQMFYLPAIAHKDAVYEFVDVEGALLDYDSLDLPRVDINEAAEPPIAALQNSKLIFLKNAKAPPEKIEALCSVHHEFRATWELQRKFPSASEYELSLFAMAAHSELIWTDQELVDLGIEFRHRYGFPQKWEKNGNAIKYYQETIAKARKNGEIPATAALVQPEELHNTELGNACRLVQLHGKDLRYCHDLKRWLIFDGKRWRFDMNGTIHSLAKTVIRAMLKEAADVTHDDARNKLIKHALDSEKAVRIQAMIKLAESEPGIPVSPEELDTDKYLLNCDNGTIDLRTGVLREHRREDLITKLLPIEYDPNAQAPIWDAFLKHIMNDNENLISFLRRAVGYSLTGDVSERVLFICYGLGANGKSVFLETIHALLGEYAMRAPTSMLLTKRDASVPNDIARLKGTRFVHSSESEEGKRFDEATVKDLTGNDTITARFMRAEWFDFKPQFKLWLRTNHKPIVRGSDEAIWDRLKLIPFAVRIPDYEQDKHLSEKLSHDLPGILAWAVYGCLEWLQRGRLGIPEEVKNATLKYRCEQDNFANFINDCCVIRETSWSPAAALREAYQQWTNERGESPVAMLSGNAFADRLQALGCFPKKGRHAGKVVRGWQGIGLQ